MKGRTDVSWRVSGDLWWYVTGLTGSCRHLGDKASAVVIQNNVFNQSRINTVLVCALTSNLKGLMRLAT
jgi:mRNA interferase MazF